MDDRTHSFGYWLRRRRKALDLTQEALAATVSCTRFTIRKIEADERRPSRRLAERLADKLAVPAAERDAFLEAARALRPVAKLRVDRLPLQEPGSPPRTGDSPFVGRANEYGLLTGLLARLTAGAGHAVLVEGEPGIGKSRLMRELAQYARANDLCTFTAGCFEIERATPYQPVIDLVSQALDVASADVLARLPPIALAEIAALVPELAARVSVPALSADLPPARQARLLRAIVQLLESVAEGRQLVVVIDDIHWADEASLKFVHYLARQAATHPFLILCAYRDEELGAHPGLASLADGLSREPHVRHVRLARLGQGDAEQLVEGLGDPRLNVPGLAARLHRETDGNPFFMTSILDALTGDEAPAGAAGELPLPEALRAAVRARLAHIPAEARPALDVAAVLGRRFDFDTLLAVTGESEEILLTALEALVTRRLLREHGDDGLYDFSHDKVREVVYREIGAARRIGLHRAVAEALEQHPEADAGESDAHLAEHYERGHAWSKARHYLMLAGERSEKLFALRDALHWFDRAVALAEAHPDAAQDIDTLYARRGAARAQAGQTDGAVSDFRRVIDSARHRGDRRQVRDTLIQLGMAYRRADDYRQATQCLTEALAECRAMDDEAGAADTLYHLGTVAWSDGRNREAIGYHEGAVEICERLALTGLAAVQAWHGRGESHFASLEPARAIACYERSIDLARRIGDRGYESENLMMVGYACTGFGGLADYPRAEASYEAALDIARKADLQWHLGPTLLGLDHVRACLGREQEALDGMLGTLHWLESVNQTRYQLMAHDLIAHLLLEMGDNAQAAARCEAGLALAQAARVAFWCPRLEANLAIAHLRAGRLDAGPNLERTAEYCRRSAEGYHLARCLEALCELALARGDAPTCLAHADELLAIAEPAGLRELAAQARRWRGAALLAQERVVPAKEELGLALQGAREIGRVRLVRDLEAALARQP